MVKIGVTVYLKVNYQKKKLNPKKKWRERENHVQGLFESIIYKPVQSYILKVHVAQN